MNVLKKTGALTLVLMLAVCFCAMASATTVLPAEGVASNDSGISTLSFTSAVSAGARYAGSATYTINEGAVKAGTGSTKPSVLFTNPTPDEEDSYTFTQTVAAGYEASSSAIPMTLDASLADDGVYEFVITQTLTAGFTANTPAATMNEGTKENDGVLYLDVVVKNYKVTQAVLLNTTGATDGQNDTSNKVAGFTYASAYTSGNDVTLEKTVAGNYAAINNGTFTFSVTIAKGLSDSIDYGNMPFTIGTGTGVSVTGTGLGSYTAGDTNNATFPASSNATFTVNVNTATANYGELTISGLPVDATVTIEETGRGIAAETTATVNDVAQTFTTTGEGENANTVYSVVATVDSDVQAVVFTNTFNEISLTGVTLRYAPYLLTLGAGLVVLPMTRTYRRREDY